MGGYRGRTPFVSKAFKSSILEITSDTFNTGQIKFSDQFTQSTKKIASYLQRSVENEAYMVAQTIRTGVLQTIDLPPPIPANDPEADDLIIVREEVVREVAKRRIALNTSYMKTTRSTACGLFAGIGGGRSIVCRTPVLIVCATRYAYFKAVAVAGTEDERRSYRRRSNPLS